ncbi:MAG: hypothetical protein L3J06_06510 [Cyclobacteriaceae bacterium]|nr:hypothetical protein [Cyclobacteriaceae bacterium]
MFIPFNQLPSTARVWAYQADRTLDAFEVEWITDSLTSFCDNWAAHGAGLKSSFQILHKRFIIIAIDEDHNRPTGCSIDSSVNQIKIIEQKFRLNFMDRTQVAFLIKNKLYIEKLSELKSSVANGIIEPNTIFFNNLVVTVGDFDSNWTIPANESWLKRYF